MIDEETKNIIKEQLDTLPSVVQDAILHSGWQEKIRQIGKKYSLHIDQVGVLENQTFTVMLGLEDPVDFEKKMVADLGLTSLIASQLSMEINELIFKPIKMELQKLEAEVEVSEENPTKESVLAGIENPVPTIQPHSAFPPLASQLAMPAPLDMGLPSTNQTPKATPPPPPAPEPKAIPKVTVMPNASTSNIVHDRLSQMVEMAKKEITLNPNPKPEGSVAPKASADPYREPV